MAVVLPQPLSRLLPMPWGRPLPQWQRLLRLHAHRVGCRGESWARACRHVRRHHHPPCGRDHRRIRGTAGAGCDRLRGRHGGGGHRGGRGRRRRGGRGRLHLHHPWGLAALQVLPMMSARRQRRRARGGHWHSSRGDNDHPSSRGRHHCPRGGSSCDHNALWRERHRCGERRLLLLLELSLLLLELGLLRQVLLLQRVGLLVVICHLLLHLLLHGSHLLVHVLLLSGHILAHFPLLVLHC
mmetsp:Transcript_125515/g.316390  ORF Transcript_125515/g.316390 Transcript_125515/m.316390 type:complete len:240 (+) Transcript_125515:54-773(+)